MRDMGRQAMSQVVGVALRQAVSHDLLRTFAVVSKVNGDGTVDLECGSDETPMPLNGVRITLGCSTVSVGDTVVVDTYDHSPLVVAVLYSNASSGHTVASKPEVDKANESAASAKRAANAANDSASSAVTTANGAVSTANAASSTAGAAKSTADAAQATADDAWSRTLRVQVSSAPADAAGDTSKLTATVWRGGELLSDEAVAKMGLLAWYVGGKRVATGNVYTCKAGTAAECRLEA